MTPGRKGTAQKTIRALQETVPKQRKKPQRVAISQNEKSDGETDGDEAEARATDPRGHHQATATADHRPTQPARTPAR